MTFDVCIDSQMFDKKPADNNAAKINARIAQQGCTVTLEELAQAIEQGQTWCPAVFTGTRKVKENIISKSLFALDFDYGLTLEEALQRAQIYKLPVALYYETFSGVNYSRFRLVFAHCTPITNYRISILIQMALYYIFPESDSSCKTDPSKLCYGGRKVRLSNDPNVYFDLYNLTISLYAYLKANDPAHSSRTLNIISKTTGVVQQGGMLRLEFSENVESTSSLSLPLPNLPNEFGEMEMQPQYILLDCHSNSPKYLICYFTKHTTRSETSQDFPVINLPSPKLKRIDRVNYTQLEQSCRIYHEFVTGTRKLEHDEWFNLLKNMIRLKGGQQKFVETLEAFPFLYDALEHKKIQIQQTVKAAYPPYDCNTWCPYCQECCHGKNILGTLKKSSQEIRRLKDFVPEYVPLKEARQELKDKLYQALSTPASGITLLKADTGTGKTHALLEYMQSCSESILLAVPTHKLIDEIYSEAQAMGIAVMTTPSIQNLLDSVPKIADEIKYIYNTGAEEQVSIYLREYIKHTPTPVIQEYLDALKTMETWQGHILTTHSRLIHMKESVLQSHRIIIDEDIFPALMSMKTVSMEDLIKLKAALKHYTPLVHSIELLHNPPLQDVTSLSCSPLELSFKQKRKFGIV